AGSIRPVTKRLPFQCGHVDIERPINIRRNSAMSKLLNSSALPAALLLCAFAVPAFAGGPNVVNDELWNKPDGSQGLTLSTYRIKPGKVVFHVKNISTDEDHELLLVKTDFPPNGLAMDADGVRVDEDKLKGLKELGD